MAEATPQNGVDCQTCRGSGQLEGQPCFACDGKGRFESHGADEEQDVAFDFGVLGDEFAGGGESDTTVPSNTKAVPTQSSASGGSILDEGDDSGSIFDAAGGFTDSPSSKMPEAQPRRFLDPEEELEELHKQMKQNQQRINVLELMIAGGLGRSGQSKAKPKEKTGRPTSTGDLLKALQRSELLDSKQLRAAQLMANDPTAFAKRLLEAKFLSRWQAAQLLKGRTEFLLGKHKMIQVIGTGSMGVVFLAKHITMNRQVALKVFSQELVQNSPFLNRFLAQTRALSGLDHPNLVQVFNADKLDNYYYLVMEYVPGQNLEEMVGKKWPLKFVLSADIIRQAAMGLSHLHANKFLHQQIRPSKLLIHSNNVVKVAQPGLSGKSIDYLAPECTGGTVDGRADVYSLGCTLYFLLTGRPPFPKGNRSQKLQQHQKAEPQNIQAFRRDTPDPLVKLCKKMMAKKPADRYPTCQDVVKDLLPLTRRLIKADAAAS